MNQAPSSIRCLFAVVDRGKGEAVSAELRRRRILTQLVLLGHGTASAEVMDLLGLDEPEKDVVLALLPGDGASPSPSTCAASARWPTSASPPQRRPKHHPKRRSDPCAASMNSSWSSPNMALPPT